MKKVVSKQLSLNTPQNLEEAGKAVKEIDDLWSEIDKILAEKEEKIKKAEEEAEKKIKEKREKIKRLGEGVAAYAQSRYDELTNKGKLKTVRLPIVGALKWRKGKKSVKLLLSVEAAVETLKERCLESLIRTKEEPDKQKILAYPKPEELEGIADIKPGKESFIIELPDPRGKKPKEIQYEIG